MTTTIPQDTPSFGVEFEFLIAVIDNPAKENPNPSDPRTVYFPPTPDDAPPSYFVIPAGKEQWTNEWSIYAHIKRTLSSIGLPTEPGKAHSNFNMWEITTDGSIQRPKPPPSKMKKEHHDWLTYTYVPIEIRTPAYYYSEDALKDVADFCKIMRKNYLIILNESCGLHVHIGYGLDGFELTHIRKLAAFIQAFEPQLESLHPEDRVGDRNFNCASFRHGTFWNWKFGHEMGREPRVLESMRFFLECAGRGAFRDATGSEGVDGAHSFVGGAGAWNFERMGTESLPRGRGAQVQDTIEVRQHKATIDPLAVTNWVRVLVGIAQYTRSVDVCGFVALLERVRGECWVRGYPSDREVGRRRYQPRGEGLYRPVFGEQWCGVVELLRILGLDGPAEYYEGRKGRWLEGGVYKHWYDRAPREYLVEGVDESEDEDEDEEGESAKQNAHGRQGQSKSHVAPPETRSSKHESDSSSGNFDPWNPNPVISSPPTLPPKSRFRRVLSGLRDPPVDLMEFGVDPAFSEEDEVEEVEKRRIEMKDSSSESFPMRPGAGQLREIRQAGDDGKDGGKDQSQDQSDKKYSPFKTSPLTLDKNPFREIKPPGKDKPPRRTGGFRVPSDSSDSSSTSTSSSPSIIKNSSEYRREAAAAAEFLKRYHEEEKLKEQQDAYSRMEAEKARTSMQHLDEDGEGSDGRRLESLRRMERRLVFEDAGKNDMEDWEPWKGPSGIDGSELEFEQNESEEEEQGQGQEFYDPIDYLPPLTHRPLPPLPAPAVYSNRTKTQHSHLLNNVPPTRIEALAPNTRNYQGRRFHRRHRVPSSEILTQAPRIAAMNPTRNPNPGPTAWLGYMYDPIHCPSALLNQARAQLADALIDDTIGQGWEMYHEIEPTRSEGIQRMLSGRSMARCDGRIQRALRHHNRKLGRVDADNVGGIFPRAAQTEEAFERTDDEWWRFEIAEATLEDLRGDLKSRDGGVVRGALDTLVRIGGRGLPGQLPGEEYWPEGVRNPFKVGRRVQQDVWEDLSPGDSGEAGPGVQRTVAQGQGGGGGEGGGGGGGGGVLWEEPEMYQEDVESPRFVPLSDSRNVQDWNLQTQAQIQAQIQTQIQAQIQPPIQPPIHPPIQPQTQLSPSHPHPYPYPNPHPHPHPQSPTRQRFSPHNQNCRNNRYYQCQFEQSESESEAGAASETRPFEAPESKPDI